MQQNPELELARKFVYYTNRNVFLTGKAGTGKTTFLHNLQRESLKRMVITAPTGVAAINAKGVTLHSFFQMPFGPILCESVAGKKAVQEQNQKRFHKINKNKIRIIKSLDLLVIDEISMVRADLLDGIDEILRRYRDRSKPFGGLQLLMIGDMQQLPPVVKDDEWRLLAPYYDTYYFFGSHALKKTFTVSVELKHIYRQSDDLFIKILNEIRNNCLSRESLEVLNARHKEGFRDKDDEGYINLTTHNYSADQINEDELQQIKSEKFTYKARITGDFPEHMHPVATQLELKKGAQVMFIKNDSNPLKRYYNGKIGKITSLSNLNIEVSCPDWPEPLEIDRETWKNIRYKINEKSKELEEEEIGTFTQYPLRLAWAITIHKSQGLTFEKAIIDAKAAFAHGQTYVALSRCKSLEGLILSTKLAYSSIITDYKVQSFNKQIEDNPPSQNTLLDAQKDYHYKLIEEIFSFKELRYQMEGLYRTARENNRIIHGQLYEKVAQMQRPVLEELWQVGNKFLVQVQHLLQTTEEIDNNEQLQQRITKAAEWFISKFTEGLEIPFNNLKWDTDNKAIKKQLNEHIEKIKEIIVLKTFAFNEFRNGFHVMNYLKLRANILAGDFAEASEHKKAKTTTEKQYVGEEHEELFDILRNWRRELANEADVPAYMILTQKALTGISQILPQNEKELLSVTGVGKKTLEAHGDDILQIVAQFCAHSKIDLNKRELPEIKEKKTKKNAVKGESQLKSLEYFQKGMSPKQIAEERELTLSTIEGHLAWAVGEGKIKLNSKLIAPEKEAIIRDWMNENEFKGLKEVRDALGETFSFGELRLVQSSISFEEKANEQAVE